MKPSSAHSGGSGIVSTAEFVHVPCGGGELAVQIVLGADGKMRAYLVCSTCGTQELVGMWSVTEWRRIFREQ